MKKIIFASTILVWGLACKPAAITPPPEEFTPTPTPAAASSTPTPSSDCNPCTTPCAGYSWTSDGQHLIGPDGFIVPCPKAAKKGK